MPQETHAAKPKGKKTRHFASLFTRSSPAVTELPPKAPPAVEKAVEVPTEKPGQKPSPSLDKRQSKLNLFDLFSKPKVEVAYGHHEGAAIEALPERSQTPAHFYRRPEQQQAPKRAPARPSSRLNGPIEKAPQQAAPSRPRPPDDWDPPPLFQAYPQAVKHGALQGTNLSAEILLRAQHYRQNVMLPNAFGSTTSLAFVREGPEGDQVAHEAKKIVASRRFSTLAEAPELVEKIFVLATSGRLCQYAGEGNYDRMPEKVLQLGEKSAAFACDLIPGKHWVVQVVQAANEDGVATINKSRSLLSRLRMPSSARRTTTSFLLVFSSAEDMDGWLRAIRKVIDQINGKKTSPGEGRHSRQNTAEKVTEDAVPTHRYRVQRPPSMIQSIRTRSSSAHSQQPRSHPESPKEPTSMHFPPSKNISIRPSPIDSPQMTFEEGEHSPSVTSRITSVDAPSLATTAASTSTDQLRLDELRESFRHSLISIRTSRTSETETGTVATSQTSSDPPSPAKETSLEPEPPVRGNTGTFKSSFVIPHAPFNTRRLSAQPIPVLRTTPGVMHTSYASGSQRYPPLDFSDRFWLTKPSPTPSPIVVNRRSRSSTGNYPQTRTLKALSTSKPIDDDEGVKFQKRDSTFGQLPNLASRSLSRTETPRVKPFLRPLPVRPSEPTTTATPNRTSQSFEPRRFSSLPIQPKATTPSAIPEQPPTKSMHRFSMMTPAPNPPPSAAPPVLPPSRASTRFSVVPSVGAYSAPAAPVQPPRRASTRFSVVPRAVTPDLTAAPAVQPPPRSSSRISMVPEMEAEMEIEMEILPEARTTTPTITMRPRAPSYSVVPAIQTATTQTVTQPKNLRRPTSMQIRSDPAPFLSTRRTTSYRASSANFAPPIPVRDPSRPSIRPQMSMPTIMIPGLPPPAPPPSIPLPPPPVMQAMI